LPPTEEVKEPAASPKRSISQNATTLLVAVIGVIGGWGTAYLSNYDKIEHGQKLSEQAHTWASLREGHYQWQWGKEGWLGDISVKKDDAGLLCATIDVSKYCVHGGLPVGKVLLSRGCGVVSHTSDGRPKLTVPVVHTLYDDKCKATHDVSETLVILLNPKEAYTGSVDYIRETGKTSAGGIALVNWEYTPQTTQNDAKH
jgi:hypothetical protein